MIAPKRRRSLSRALAVFFLLTAPVLIDASHTPDPTSVTIAGSLQSELGCPGDWQPDCAATHLVFDAEDDVWQGVFDLPAGTWDYKAPLNDSWDENYGAGAQRDGPNIGLHLAAASEVKFYYDHESHWVTDDLNSAIATAVGSFQSVLGCSDDWQPACLRSWLQDPDGDDLLVFNTTDLPAGSYEVKVAHDESWDENYGAGGVPGGANIPFSVPAHCAEMSFEYDLSSHLLTVTEAPPTPQPATVTITGSFQQELGCPGDWQPDCSSTHLSYDADDDLWQEAFSIPAGSWEYKAALDDSWDENYGANAQRNGPNIGLTLSEPSNVKFYYSDATHWVTDSQSEVIATLAGNFQTELGCPGDWQPACLRSWLQDPDGDGSFTFTTGQLPAGSYEVKVAHNESWDENYGEGGVRNGPNISFNVPFDCAEVFFVYDADTHELTIGTEIEPHNQPPTALCGDVIVAAGVDCLAAADVDQGSFDPDGDPITLSQDPPGPYGLGQTVLTLTVEDDQGASQSCEASVTVEDRAAPVLSCNAPDTIVPPDAPVSFMAMATDNCGPTSAAITHFDCFKFTSKGKRVDKTDSCVVGIDGDTLTVLDSGGVGTHIAWGVTATDAGGNSRALECEIQVANPGKRP
jgi:hypothetical protein